jgi:hypothetical protein
MKTSREYQQQQRNNDNRDRLRLEDGVMDHRNNTVSGKLSALALRGKRARQFIALNLSAN